MFSPLPKLIIYAIFIIMVNNYGYIDVNPDDFAIFIGFEER